MAQTVTVNPTTIVDTISAIPSADTDPTAAIAKVNGDNTIDLTLLSDEEKEKYARMARGINPKDINSVVNYGAELQNKMNRHSNALLGAVRINKAGAEISELVDNLLDELSCVDVEELAPQNSFKRFIRRVPIVRHLVTSVEKIMKKYDTVEKNIAVISDKIMATRQRSLMDNAVLQKMFDDNIIYIQNIGELITAARIKQVEINAKLAEMKANVQDYEAYQISDMEEFANSLDRRINDMQTLHYVMKQSLPQIRLVQNNNLAIANKAQSIISTTIPVWRDQITIAIGLDNQKNSILAQRKVVDATNEIMKRNADMLHQNSINVAKENERAIIDIETLRVTTEKLIDTIREVKEIHEQGKQQRREAEAEILKIEQELESTMHAQNDAAAYYLK